MRRDWDARAAHDAMYYIATWRRDWDPASFLASGDEDYRTLVEPVLADMHFEPRGKTMLELGCGAGRMTKAFARRFGEVHAVDVSSEMLRRGRELLADEPHIHWHLGTGTDLAWLQNRSMDFVFTYLMLHHLPTLGLVSRYVEELLRLLREGGLFLIEFNSDDSPTMNWRGRCIWRLLEALDAAGLTRLSRSVASRLDLDPHMVGPTWTGATVDVRDVLETVWRSRASVRGVIGWGSSRTWCYGTKGAG